MKTMVAQLLAGFLLLANGIDARAEVYRCVDDEGHVIFTQHRCGPAQQGGKVDLGTMDVNRKPSAEVCKEVEKLANLIFPHINQTDSILDIYSDLGGREYLSAGITAAVNYVFNFRYNPKARQSDVVTLTHDKCIDGGFGRITEKDLPAWERIKYAQEQHKEPVQTKQQKDEREKNCAQYDEKIKKLQGRLLNAKTKSEKLQVRVDLEYVAGLKKDQCKSDIKEQTKSSPSK